MFNPLYGTFSRTYSLKGGNHQVELDRLCRSLLKSLLMRVFSYLGTIIGKAQENYPMS